MPWAFLCLQSAIHFSIEHALNEWSKRERERYRVDQVRYTARPTGSTHKYLGRELRKPVYFCDINGRQLSSIDLFQGLIFLVVPIFQNHFGNSVEAIFCGKVQGGVLEYVLSFLFQINKQTLARARPGCPVSMYQVLYV